VTATLLVPPDQLGGEAVTVVGEAYRHLFRARRLAVGDAVRLVDGRGNARLAAVTAVDRQRALLQPGERVAGNDPLRRVELLVASPRPERSAWLVEKATELGVSAVRFLDCERAVRGVDGRSLARLGRVAAAALEQSGGARLPELSGPHPFTDVPRLLDGLSAWVLDPSADAPAAVAGDEPLAVLVGPEGGWSEAEVAALRAAGAWPVSLGKRILRVETAAIVAATLAGLARP
jgi:16S rRNA (uracil1498-N3)-methyltransferase